MYFLSFLIIYSTYSITEWLNMCKKLCRRIYFFSFISLRVTRIDVDNLSYFPIGHSSEIEDMDLDRSCDHFSTFTLCFSEIVYHLSWSIKP